MKVKEIMTAPVICARAEASPDDVASLLAEHRISAVPVVDDSGCVVGLVSEQELMARRGEAARDIMSRGIVSVDEEADVEAVSFLLIDRRLRRVPVLAGQKLVGILSRTDILRHLAVQWCCDCCGEPVRGEGPPSRCPKCSATAAHFAQLEPPPGD